MGHFLAVSAFRTEGADLVCQAISDYCAGHGCSCDVRDPASDAEERTDLSIYEAANGWVRVLWPSYFNVHDFALCRVISADKHLMVSTVHVYDGDFWEHLFLDSGKVIDEFSSWPHYFAETPDDVAKAKAKWKGNPAGVAAIMNVPGDDISGYYVHLPVEAPQPPAQKKSLFSWFGGKKPPPEPVEVKAYATDEFDLENFWVFTDFWRKLGITYPDPPDAGIVRSLRLSRWFAKKLPSEG